MTGPVSARLPDGKRLHFQHGPMDLILEVTAPSDVAALAEARAWQRFGEVLDELVPQLDLLRAPVTGGPIGRRGGGAEAAAGDAGAATPFGPIAERMVVAASAFPGVFVTPMAAVAGSVAQEICQTIGTVEGVRRAYVNNGGDIALHLSPGESMTVGLVASIDGTTPEGSLHISASSGIRGLATSGWGGRSFSLGIADSVTVLGAAAALADLAATLIANAVDLPGHPAIERSPANALEPASDLGDRLVTVSVGQLSDEEVDLALGRGAMEANAILTRLPELRGVIITLAGRRRVLGRAAADPTQISATPGQEMAHAC